MGIRRGSNQAMGGESHVGSVAREMELAAIPINNRIPKSGSRLPTDENWRYRLPRQLECR